MNAAPGSDPRILLQKLRIQTPVVACYESDEAPAGAATAEPPHSGRYCLFQFYPRWVRGETLALSRERSGCRGCGHWLFGVTRRSRADFIRFLVEEEGLKASPELMEKWIDAVNPYHPAVDHLYFGPYVRESCDTIRTITFFVNPDQLSALIIGAHFHHSPGQPPPVSAPFGSGCMQLLTLFDRSDYPHAVIGATDTAMRRYLPPDLLAFSVTYPMFARLCELDEASFLFKPFWSDLMKERDVSIGNTGESL